MNRTRRLFEIGDDIWEMNFPFSLMGVQLGRRMVIIREPGGGLQLHSPGLIAGELKLELERLGPVSSLVVPTNFHDTFVPEALKTFPDAVLYAPPGFADHCRTDHPAIPLDEAPASWAEILVQQVLAWDFDRLIPSHGRIVPSGARQRLKQEFTI